MHKVLVLEAGGECGLEAMRSLERMSDTEVVPVDADPLALCGFHPNFQVVDAGDRPRFVSGLRALVKKLGITHILPTGHVGLARIAAEAKDFAPCKVLLSPASVIERAHDKASFIRWQRQLAMVPKTSNVWTKETPFAKPRNGKGSRGIEVVLSEQQAAPYNGEYIFQELLTGDTQFTVDVLTRPTTGQPLQAVVREVFKLRNGSDVIATVHPGHELEQIALDFADILGIQGVCNMEFKQDHAGDWKVMDVNVRLSAGFGITESAGFPILDLLMRYADGHDLSYFPFPITPIKAFRSLTTTVVACV